MLSSAGYPKLGSVHLLVATMSWVCAFMNPIGFKFTFDSYRDNPWVIFNHSPVPNTCGMHHGSYPGLATVRVGNEELLPWLKLEAEVWEDPSVLNLSLDRLQRTNNPSPVSRRAPSAFNGNVLGTYDFL